MNNAPGASCQVAVVEDVLSVVSDSAALRLSVVDSLGTDKDGAAPLASDLLAVVGKVVTTDAFGAQVVDVALRVTDVGESPVSGVAVNSAGLQKVVKLVSFTLWNVARNKEDGGERATAEEFFPTMFLLDLPALVR